MRLLFALARNNGLFSFKCMIQRRHLLVKKSRELKHGQQIAVWLLETSFEIVFLDQ